MAQCVLRLRWFSAEEHPNRKKYQQKDMRNSLCDLTPPHVLSPASTLQSTVVHVLRNSGALWSSGKESDMSSASNCQKRVCV
jgi:hypothetical protein